VERATAYRERQSDDLRPLTVFPLPSRIDIAEDERSFSWRMGNRSEHFKGYQPEFEELFRNVYGIALCDLSAYFDKVQIQYVPRYGYGEEIAVLVEQQLGRTDRLSLTEAYESFTERLLKLNGPWETLEEATASDLEVEEEKDEQDLVDTALNVNAAKGDLARRRVRVFLSSPGDVVEERSIVRRVIDDLTYDPSLSSRGVTLQLLAWDMVYPQMAQMETLTPQEAINHGLSRPSEADIVIVILWSRMGTSLGPKYRKPDGSPYLSGTEWEFQDAIRAAQQFGRPRVLVYRRSQEISLRSNDPDFMEKVKQFQQVEQFFSSFVDPDGSIRQAYNVYETVSQFHLLLMSHLKSVVLDLLASIPQVEGVQERSQGIYISYRWADSAGYAGRIYDRLSEKFAVFMDVETPAGVDFFTVFEQALRSSAVLLVLIGKDWLQPDLNAKLHEPDDFVHHEIATGLQRNITVIPALLDDARMPPADALPRDLRKLATLQGFAVRHGSFNLDMRRLIDLLRKVLNIL